MSTPLPVARVAALFVTWFLLFVPRIALSQCFCDPCFELRGQIENVVPTEPNVCPPCNVLWQVPDSIAACPAGDTLKFAHGPTHPHPSRIRVWIRYTDDFCMTKVDVPPESIYVTYQTISGSARVNDEGARVYAEDSTDAAGETRITIPSLSGCGKIRLRLYIADQLVLGYKDIVVRTVDSNADQRVNSSDASTSCDFNYNTTLGDTTEARLRNSNHDQHWHRNALHGTLVKRTVFCESCDPGENNTVGFSPAEWSPSQRYLAFTSFVDDGEEGTACKSFIAPANPADGHAMVQISFGPLADHDYNPTWSPLNDLILFDRADKTIIKTPPPWLGLSETVLTTSTNCAYPGDLMPAVSPDGQWVAFSRCNGSPTGGYSLWKIPITGGTATQLTAAAARSDHYSTWSADGAWIYFQRADASIGTGWHLWKVPAAGGTAVEVFHTPSSPQTHAANPMESPDGKILLAAFGVEDAVERKIFTHTLDPALSSPNADKMVPNYARTEFATGQPFDDFPTLWPRLSPDGTRTALVSKQVWAARRNMNLPPRITQVGTQGVSDTASKVEINAQQGSQTTVTITATDPESNPITCSAYFLQNGMSYNPSNCTLTWTPTAAVGTKYYVKFRVTNSTYPNAPGGTDAIIAIFTVTAPGLAPGGDHLVLSRAVEGPNPTDGRFIVNSPFVRGVAVTLTVFDPSGRKVSVIRAPSGSPLVWEGRNRQGAPLPPGIYGYRMEAGRERRDGKIVLIR